VSGDDICIGKTDDYIVTQQMSKNNSNILKKTKKDISVNIRPTENGIIDSVLKIFFKI